LEPGWSFHLRGAADQGRHADDPSRKGGQDRARENGYRVEMIARTHGVAGLVNLFGIESPGLTSCLAIADEVIARLGLDELKEEE